MKKKFNVNKTTLSKLPPTRVLQTPAHKSAWKCPIGRNTKRGVLQWCHHAGLEKWWLFEIWLLSQLYMSICPYLLINYLRITTPQSYLYSFSAHKVILYCMLVLPSWTRVRTIHPPGIRVLFAKRCQTSCSVRSESLISRVVGALELEAIMKTWFYSCWTFSSYITVYMGLSINVYIIVVLFWKWTAIYWIY